MTASFDLTAILAALPKDDTYPLFRKLVTRLSSIETTIADLEDAQFAVKIAQEMVRTGDFQSNEGAMRAESLMVYAVIAYCRAAHSDPIDRQRVGTGKRSPELNEAHKQITALRDRVLTHYGHGAEQLGGQWRHEPFVMRVEEDKIAFGYASTRAAFREQVIQDLDALTSEAVAQLRANSMRWQEQLAAEVERLGDDQAFLSVAHAHRFDQRKFFRGRDVGAAPSVEYQLTRSI